MILVTSLPLEVGLPTFFFEWWRLLVDDDKSLLLKHGEIRKPTKL